MFSDAHAHLRGDIDRTIQRSKEEGVTIILTAGINLQTSIEAVEAAKAYDIVYASVGIHPWHADEFNEDAYRRLRNLARGGEVVAISEIGLDFFGRMGPDRSFRPGDFHPRPVQMEAFRRQIGLAKEVGKPIVFHVREAGAEVVRVLMEEDAPGVGGAVHGFSGDWGLAEEFIEMGFYISIGRRGLTSGNLALRDVIKRVPMDRLLIETDSSEPYNVKEVVERVAGIKGKAFEEVGGVTTSNLRRLLRI
ncbi:MAG: TatD family hydrolase [Candidatus Bathyarchaeia archaeon]